MTALSAADEAFRRELEERKKNDPMVGVRIGGLEALDVLMRRMQTERGVHVESVLAALGALAGLACLHGALDERAAGQGSLIVINTDSGKFYSGDSINKPLAENKYSVWTIASGGAKRAGVKEMPDVGEMFAHIAGSLGGPDFGKARVPDTHRPGDDIATYTAILWPVILPTLNFFCDHKAEWPLLLGYGLQELIVKTKDIIPPDIALRLAMETAIASSKMDPAPHQTVQ